MAIAKKIKKETKRESTSRYINEHYQDMIEQKITRPKIKFDYFQYQRSWVIVGAVVVVILASAGVWLNIQAKKQAIKASESQAQEVQPGWFAVKLLDGEVVYGKIDNLKTDLITINPVYYNYEQVKEGASKDQKINETADLRLVKRGQETHGPDGALEVFKSQFVYMERLKTDSRVYQAIMENEK